MNQNQKRINFPILIKLSAIILVLLTIIAGIITWQNVKFFDRVSSEREEAFNLTTIKSLASQVDAYSEVYVDKLKSYSISLKAQTSIKSSTFLLKEKLKRDSDLIGFEIIKLADFDSTKNLKIYNYEFLTANKLSSSDFFTTEDLSNDLSSVGSATIHRKFVKFPYLKLIIPLVKDRNGVVTHIAIGFFRIDKVQKIFSEISVDNICLVDDRGEIIAHTDEELLVKKPSESLQKIIKEVIDSKSKVLQKYILSNSKPTLRTHAKTSLSLTVLNLRDRALIELPSKIATEQSIYWFGIILSIGFFFIFLLSTSITKPIEILLKLTKEISRGNFKIDASKLVKTKDELGHLAVAFDEMAEGLEEREKIKDVFSKFHGADIADEILHTELNKIGDEKEVTIFFSDIRGFTDFSEKHSAQEVVEMLNEYFKIMVGIIIKHNGVVDKFIGDAIMGVWGIPEKSSEDIDNCVKACLEMREKLVIFNNSRIKRGKDPLKIGMGVHHGKVISGTVGSSERMEYTVIGDNVNMAARIESSTKKFETDLLVSEVVANKIKSSFSIENVGNVKVKGRNEGLNLYKVPGYIQGND